MIKIEMPEHKIVDRTELADELLPHGLLNKTLNNKTIPISIYTIF